MSQKRFRFVVSSAEEAINVLRERLGDKARVVSVRQVEGTGLAKFLQAPKLEVIAELADAEIPQGTPAATETPRVQNIPSPGPSVETPAPELTPSSSSSPSSPSSSSPTPIVVVAPEAERTSKLERPKETTHPPNTLTRLLRAGGMPAQVLARLQSAPDWETLDRMPPGRALTQVGMHLREEFHATKVQPLGDRVAFVGSPGAGKTTALCKWLANKIFVCQQRGVVLKLDLDKANPSDALAVFCEALGVPCARSIPDVPTLAPDQTLYIDVPGMIPDREDEATQLADALAPLFTTSRVIVVNAAYDSSLIKRAYEFAEHAGCTHAVFTHLDELSHWGKLWEFLIGQKLTPLFLSTGPNIAGDLEENVFDAVLARTFPSAGAQVAQGDPTA